MRCKLFLVFGIILFIAQPAVADRGSIPFNPHVQVFEPSQRAIIGWNGREEVLILTTDLSASAPTKVLEVLPLPSEPTVSESDIEVFEKLTALINKKLRELSRTAKGGRKKNGDGEDAPAAEVTFHEKIGAHDITVFHVLDGGGFVGWVEAYLRKQGVKEVVIPEPMKKVVDEYLSAGFAWFVFDVVSLDKRPKTNNAIQYRFKSRSLYYPLKITRTESGETTIDMIVLTHKPLKLFPGISGRRVELRHKLITIQRRELADINRSLYELFKGHRDLTLRIWRIQGRLAGFTHDLIAN